MRKVIVTGGAGFIGSHLVDSLLKINYSVTVLDNFSTGRLENLKHVRERIELVECDISIPGDWAQHFNNADWVFHLAALADIVPSIQQPEAYFRANVDGTFNVLQAAKTAEVNRFIYIASSSCYGIPDNFPTPEDADIRPQYPYALAKRLGEELVIHWAQVYNFPALSLRLFNVYGPRARTYGAYGAMFGVFLAQKLAGKPFTIVGDGYQTRDFVFVSDIVKAMTLAAESDIIGEIFNVGSGKPVSVNHIVELLGGGEKLTIPKRPGEPDCSFGDISRIQDKLKWRANIPIEAGVEIMLENIKLWENAPVWDVESIKEATSDWFRYLQNESEE
jgi:UDP-glucose 4-epimerase